jgi:HSP20 family protein
MVAARKSTGPKRPTGAPKHPAGGAKAGVGGARPKESGAEPNFKVGGSFGGAAGGMPFGLDGLFGLLGNVVEQLNDAAEKAEKGEFHREGEFNVKGLGEKGRGIYGVSVKMGLGGEPAVQTFGNIHPTKKGKPEVSEVREPLVDVFDEDDEVLVIAEMPGVAEEDISVKVSGDQLKIVTKGEFQYGKEVELPTKVKQKPTRKTYRNGLLELRFTKA